MTPTVSRIKAVHHRIRRLQSLHKLGQEFQAALGRYWRRQAAAVMRALPAMGIREAAIEIPEGIAWDEIREDLVAEIEGLLVSASQRGQRDVLARLYGGAVLDLPNPAAVEYARQRAAELVTKIDEVTRARLRAVIVDALERGTPYDEVAATISEMFEGFSEARATTVATYEMGMAYETTSARTAAEVNDAGVPVLKSWLTAGDDRVEPECAINAVTGWIPIGETFPSGHDHPLAHPNCRCTLLYQAMGEMPDGTRGPYEEPAPPPPGWSNPTAEMIGRGFGAMFQHAIALRARHAGWVPESARQAAAAAQAAAGTTAAQRAAVQAAQDAEAAIMSGRVRPPAETRWGDVPTQSMRWDAGRRAWIATIDHAGEQVAVTWRADSGWTPVAKLRRPLPVGTMVTPEWDETRLTWRTRLGTDGSEYLWTSRDGGAWIAVSPRGTAPARIAAATRGRTPPELAGTAVAPPASTPAPGATPVWDATNHEWRARDRDGAWWRWRDGRWVTTRQGALMEARGRDDLAMALAQIPGLGWRVAGPRGTTPGGIYVDEEGTRHYAKWYRDPAQAWCEHLAATVYRLLGIGAAETKVTTASPTGGILAARLVAHDGELWSAGVTKALALEVLRGWVADIVLANWDALAPGNILLVAGAPVRVDNGGTLLFRAKGGRKALELVLQPTEWEALPAYEESGYPALMQAAMLSGPDEIPDLAEQIARVEELAAEGWARLVARHAPGLTEDDARTVVAALERRTEYATSRVAEAMQRRATVTDGGRRHE